MIDAEDEICTKTAKKEDTSVLPGIESKVEEIDDFGEEYDSLPTDTILKVEKSETVDVLPVSVEKDTVIISSDVGTKVESKLLPNSMEDDGSETIHKEKVGSLEEHNISLDTIDTSDVQKDISSSEQAYTVEDNDESLSDSSTKESIEPISINSDSESFDSAAESDESGQDSDDEEGVMIKEGLCEKPAKEEDLLALPDVAETNNENMKEIIRKIRETQESNKKELIDLDQKLDALPQMINLLEKPSDIDIICPPPVKKDTIVNTLDKSKNTCENIDQVTSHLPQTDLVDLEIVDAATLTEPEKEEVLLVLPDVAETNNEIMEGVIKKKEELQESSKTELVDLDQELDALPKETNLIEEQSDKKIVCHPSVEEDTLVKTLDESKTTQEIKDQVGSQLPQTELVDDDLETVDTVTESGHDSNVNDTLNHEGDLIVKTDQVEESLVLPETDGAIGEPIVLEESMKANLDVSMLSEDPDVKEPTKEDVNIVEDLCTKTAKEEDTSVLPDIESNVEELDDFGEDPLPTDAILKVEQSETVDLLPVFVEKDVIMSSDADTKNQEISVPVVSKLLPNTTEDDGLEEIHIEKVASSISSKPKMCLTRDELSTLLLFNVVNDEWVREVHRYTSQRKKRLSFILFRNKNNRKLHSLDELKEELINVDFLVDMKFKTAYDHDIVSNKVGANKAARRAAKDWMTTLNVADTNKVEKKFRQTRIAEESLVTSKVPNASFPAVGVAVAAQLAIVTAAAKAVEKATQEAVGEHFDEPADDILDVPLIIDTKEIIKEELITQPETDQTNDILFEGNREDDKFTEVPDNQATEIALNKVEVDEIIDELPASLEKEPDISSLDENSKTVGYIADVYKTLLPTTSLDDDHLEETIHKEKVASLEEHNISLDTIDTSDVLEDITSSEQAYTVEDNDESLSDSSTKESIEPISINTESESVDSAAESDKSGQDSEDEEDAMIEEELCEEPAKEKDLFVLPDEADTNNENMKEVIRKIKETQESSKQELVDLDQKLDALPHKINLVEKDTLVNTFDVNKNTHESIDQVTSHLQQTELVDLDIVDTATLTEPEKEEVLLVLPDVAETNNEFMEGVIKKKEQKESSKIELVDLDQELDALHKEPNLIEEQSDNNICCPPSVEKDTLVNILDISKTTQEIIDQVGSQLPQTELVDDDLEIVDTVTESGLDSNVNGTLNHEGDLFVKTDQVEESLVLPETDGEIGEPIVLEESMKENLEVCKLSEDPDVKEPTKEDNVVKIPTEDMSSGNNTSKKISTVVKETIPLVNVLQQFFQDQQSVTTEEDLENVQKETSECIEELFKDPSNDDDKCTGTSIIDIIPKAEEITPTEKAVSNIKKVITKAIEKDNLSLKGAKVKNKSNKKEELTPVPQDMGKESNLSEENTSSKKKKKKSPKEDAK